MDNKIYDFQKNLRKWIERVKVECFDIGPTRALLSTLMKKVFALIRKKGESHEKASY
jgi:hypothetical protein